MWEVLEPKIFCEVTGRQLIFRYFVKNRVTMLGEASEEKQKQINHLTSLADFCNFLSEVRIQVMTIFIRLISKKLMQ